MDRWEDRQIICIINKISLFPSSSYIYRSQYYNIVLYLLWNCQVHQILPEKKKKEEKILFNACNNKKKKKKRKEK